MLQFIEEQKMALAAYSFEYSIMPVIFAPA